MHKPRKQAALATNGCEQVSRIKKAISGLGTRPSVRANQINQSWAWIDLAGQ